MSPIGQDGEAEWTTIDIRNHSQAAGVYSASELQFSGFSSLG